MPQKKIAVYTMAKNEAKNVAEFAESVRGADYVVVTDTGSTDDTPRLLQAAGITVKHAAIMPWRFDTATNVALCNVPADADICVKLDLDERIVSLSSRHWCEELRDAWQENTQQLYYRYIWSWENGQPGVVFRTGNIHARSGFSWRHPGHAALCYSRGNPTLHTTDSIEIHHYPQAKVRPNYIHLLELGVFENRCPRTLFYLGREYVFAGEFTKAVGILSEYLTDKRSVWVPERAAAHVLLGRAYSGLQDTANANCNLFMASQLQPQTREIWWEFAHQLWRQHDAAGTLWACTHCLAIQSRADTWLLDSTGAWTDAPHQLRQQARDQVCK